MTLKMTLICAGSLVIVSCNSSEKSASSQNDAFGVYVRNYAVEITNPETGDKIGMRQIRDSIFVDQADNGFKVVNRKWRSNDYDQEGWVSMEHSDDRPMPTFMASYDETSASLISPENVSGPMFIDHRNGKLFRDKSKDVEYLKTQ